MKRVWNGIFEFIMRAIWFIWIVGAFGFGLILGLIY